MIKDKCAVVVARNMLRSLVLSRAVFVSFVRSFVRDVVVVAHDRDLGVDVIGCTCTSMLRKEEASTREALVDTVFIFQQTIVNPASW